MSDATQSRRPLTPDPPSDFPRKPETYRVAPILSERAGRLGCDQAHYFWLTWGAHVRERLAKEFCTEEELYDIYAEVFLGADGTPQSHHSLRRLLRDHSTHWERVWMRRRRRHVWRCRGAGEVATALLTPLKLTGDIYLGSLFDGPFSELAGDLKHRRSILLRHTLFRNSDAPRSQKVIAGQTGQSKRTVQRLTKQLSDEGRLHIDVNEFSVLQTWQDARSAPGSALTKGPRLERPPRSGGLPAYLAYRTERRRRRVIAELAARQLTAQQGRMFFTRRDVDDYIVVTRTCNEYRLRGSGYQAAPRSAVRRMRVKARSSALRARAEHAPDCHSITAPSKRKSVERNRDAQERAKQREEGVAIAPSRSAVTMSASSLSDASRRTTYAFGSGVVRELWMKHALGGDPCEA
jgi:hypothetical protein